MKKFKWIAILIISLIALGTSNMAFSATEEPLFTFVQISDTHIATTDPNHLNNQNLALAIQQINELQPDFVIVTGDIIDGYPGDDISLNTAQFETFQEIMQGLNAPYYAIGGNHDGIGPGYNPISDVLGTVANFSFSDENMYFIGLTSSAITYTTLGSTLGPGVYFEVYGDEFKEKLSAALRHQYVALKAMLEEAKNEGKQIVLFTHYLPTPYPISDRDVGRPGMEDFDKFMEEDYNKYVDNFYNLLNEYDIAFVATGHNHSYSQDNIEGLGSTIGITAPGLSFLPADQTGYVVYEVYEDKIVATAKYLNGDSSWPYVIGGDSSERIRQGRDILRLENNEFSLAEVEDDTLKGVIVKMPDLGRSDRARRHIRRPDTPDGVNLVPSLASSSEERLDINSLR